MENDFRHEPDLIKREVGFLRPFSQSFIWYRIKFKFLHTPVYGLSVLL